MKGCKLCGRCCTVLGLNFKIVGFDDKWVEGRGGWRKGMDVFVPSRCKWLTKMNTCEIHESKPEFCKGWPENIIVPHEWLMNLGCKYFE